MVKDNTKKQTNQEDYTEAVNARRAEEKEKIAETKKKDTDTPHPPIDEKQILSDAFAWIEATNDNRAILEGWLDRITGLSAPDMEAVKNAVHKKTGTVKGILNTSLKEKKASDKKAKYKADAEKKSKNREGAGIREIMYHATATGICCKKVSIALSEHPEKLVYRYAGNLIKITRTQPNSVRQVKKIHDAGGRYPSVSIITQLTTETLCHEIEKVAICQSKDENGNLKDIAWPRNIMRGVLALTESHEKPLVGIVEHPFVDEDFNPVLTQGYDEKTGLFKAFDLNPDIESFKNAEDALVYLVEHVFQDFPFSTNLDEMGAVACLLTGMQRQLINDNSGCPGFLYVAPVQASGKTTICQIISMSLDGRPVAATSYSSDDAEMAKHILGILMEGHSTILFDNIREGSIIESNELAKVLTSDTYSNRWLGKNQTITVPCNVLWLATGNNINVCGDFNTRFVVVDLDPKDANPDQRRFNRGDIGAWCEQHRSMILGACMKIIMDGSGYTNTDLKPTRFPTWDKFVRLPIHKVSGIDVAEIFQKNKLADPKIEGQRTFFETWHQVFGGAPVTVKEILTFCQGVEPDNDLMMEAVLDIFPGGALPTSNSMGKWISGMKNRFFGDYRLVYVGQGTNRKQQNKSIWSVIKQNV